MTPDEIIALARKNWRELKPDNWALLKARSAFQQQTNNDLGSLQAYDKEIAALRYPATRKPSDDPINRRIREAERERAARPKTELVEAV